MKCRIILIFAISVLVVKMSISQIIFESQIPYLNVQGGELIIYNQTLWCGVDTAGDIKVKVFPVGAFFNGDSLYSPIASFSPLINEDTLITGKELVILEQTSSNAPSAVIGNFDRSNPGASVFAFGMGLYKIEFYRMTTHPDSANPYWTFANYLYIDFRVSNVYPSDTIYGNAQDIRIDYLTKDSITFRHFPFDSIHYFYNIKDVGKNIKMWELYGSGLPALPRSLGLQRIDSRFTSFPIGANFYNTNVGHINPGDLGMNLQINHNISTRDTLLENPTNILIPKQGYMILDSGITFNIKTAYTGNNNLIVQDSSLLLLRRNSKIIVASGNTLTLKKTAHMTLHSGSEIEFDSGSYFCNEGGRINSSGSLTYKAGIHNL